MTKIQAPPSVANLIDHDEKNGYITVRQGDRRNKERSDFIVADGTIKVQKTDEQLPDILRKDERRQSNRRSSTPKLLNDDEIAILRKK
jgi:hypothetical protein